jgi:hypothetical protein
VGKSFWVVTTLLYPGTQHGLSSHSTHFSEFRCGVVWLLQELPQNFSVTSGILATVECRQEIMDVLKQNKSFEGGDFQGFTGKCFWYVVGSLKR